MFDFRLYGKNSKNRAMKHLSIFAILLFTSLTSLKAQDSLKKKFYIAERIEINPIEALINQNAISIEHRFSYRYGIELMAGYLRSVYKNGSHVPDQIFPDFSIYKGNFGLAGFKIYFPSKKVDAYLELRLKYEHTYYDNLYFYIGQLDYKIKSEYLFSNEFAITAGWIFYKWGVIPIDLYIGVGLVKNIGKTIYLGNWDYNTIYPPYEKPDDLSGFNTSLKLGIKIGLGFRKVHY